MYDELFRTNKLIMDQKFFSISLGIVSHMGAFIYWEVPAQINWVGPG